METGIIKWCTYSFFNGEYPQYIGKLKMDGIRGVIQYSSGRAFNEYWDMDFVKVFDSLIDAIKFMRDKSDRALCNIKDDLLCNFHEDAKLINWKNL
jgi:hypothetical protein